MATRQDFIIEQGKTFSQMIRWETSPIIYRPITGITQAAPAAITAAGHGIPTGWRVAVVSAMGMTQINSPVDSRQRPTIYHQATVVDVNTVTLNDVNSANYSAWISGGYIRLNTPTSLTGFTARMTIKDSIAVPNLLVCTTGGTTGTVLPQVVGADGTVVWSAAPAGSSRSMTWTPGTIIALNAVMDTHELLRLDTTNLRIVLDTINYIITLTVSAVDTAALQWAQGVYDLELVSSSNVVTGLLSGNIAITQEVTT